MFGQIPENGQKIADGRLLAISSSASGSEVAAQAINNGQLPHAGLWGEALSFHCFQATSRLF